MLQIHNEHQIVNNQNTQKVKVMYVKITTPYNIHPLVTGIYPWHRNLN